jgi:hypothetical protein
LTLHDNTVGIAAHLALGARPMDDWRVLRWDGDALRTLAGLPVEHRIGRSDVPARR